MASIIEGYSYDIFISYRQKDNKGDKWVSEFVNALKTELESTFKEDISIYFDENPHDRLQENYNVDKSLEGKLKCLIFIPILSQTYCDPDSYAWLHEFLAFIRMAEDDRFGRDVKLRSGNVTSRILPIRIHDLEPEDVKMFEKETSSVIRTLDFVFKTSSGVNRPLRVSEDHPNDNMNKTFYRDQINKVANAIKEIILSLKSETVLSIKGKTYHDEPEMDIKTESEIKEPDKPVTISQNKMIFRFAALSMVILIILFFVFREVFNSKKTRVIRDHDGRISVAVNNFENNTNDTTLNWLKMGIPELLRNNLAVSKELLVQNTQTMNELYESLEQTKAASVIPSISREAAIRLRAGIYITGSYQRYGNDILTLVKLIDTKSDELLWTGQKKGNLEKINKIVDSLSLDLRDFLEIKLLKQKVNPEYGDINTSSPEALRRYIEGMQLMMKGNFKPALQCFEESYKLDTTFVFASLYAMYASSYSSDFVTAQKWTRINYRDRNRFPYDYKLWIELSEASNVTRNCDSVLIYNDLLAQSEIKSRLFWYDIGYNYYALNFYVPDKNRDAIKAFEKVETISSEWGGDWKFADFYRYYGEVCHNAGLHSKEAKIFETGLRLLPENIYLIWAKARCAISQQNNNTASVLIEKLIEYGKTKKFSEGEIEIALGNLYAEAKSFERAEEHYRHALQLKPNDKNGINSLSYFLIVNDRNISEGMSLIESGLTIYPKDENLLRIKGFGYYKQGKYIEAFELLKNYQGFKEGQVWDLEAYKYLMEVRKALADQK
jgi:tetratricopeptide (TPR) repeat protein